MAHATHPYETLTPDAVLDALDTIGLRGDGRLTALGSYENRVYQVFLESPWDGHAQVIAKFYRPGRWSEAQLQEEHDFSAELAAAEVPVVAPFTIEGRSLHRWQDFHFSVSPRRGGRTPELDDVEVLEWTGRLLARLHLVGSAAPFVTRPPLDLQTFALEPREWLLRHEGVPLDVRSRWSAACDAAIDAAGEALERHPATRLRVHGDCHPGNILWTPDQGPHFVDLDDARTAPAVQDLWMLLSGDRSQRQRQLGGLLDGYDQLRDFDRRELALIEPLRTLLLIHYSAWLARRWDDPAFPQAFPWFGSSDYWMGQVRVLEEQLEAMAEPALVA